jgi:hypothetical protein
VKVSFTQDENTSPSFCTPQIRQIPVTIFILLLSGWHTRDRLEILRDVADDFFLLIVTAPENILLIVVEVDKVAHHFGVVEFRGGFGCFSPNVKYHNR